MRSSGDNHQVGELVRRWLEQCSVTAGDGSIGVTALGVAALSCFELAMTVTEDCGDKLENSLTSFLHTKSSTIQEAHETAI
jgi:hypothetical protein